MRRSLVIIIAMCMFLLGCSSDNQVNREQMANQQVIQNDNIANYDEDVLMKAFSDWILGTEYGIDTVKLEKDNNIIIVISNDSYD